MPGYVKRRRFGVKLQKRLLMLPSSAINQIVESIMDLLFRDFVHSLF
jgi:hypothetical protein